MRTFLLAISILLIVLSCQVTINKEQIKREIFQTEKAFEKMASEQSIADAFTFYAADSAVIIRGDELYKGKEAILTFYSDEKYSKAKVNWTPDFIDVSDCGTMAYTYGKYIWRIESNNGETVEQNGFFHTIWKKQGDGNWKYVWD